MRKYQNNPVKKVTNGRKSLWNVHTNDERPETHRNVQAGTQKRLIMNSGKRPRACF
jgi:hypothetical protein